MINIDFIKNLEMSRLNPEENGVVDLTKVAHKPTYVIVNSSGLIFAEKLKVFISLNTY